MRRASAASAAALGVLAACLLASQPAAAHGGDPNYRSTVTSINPATEGLSAEIENFDADLRLVNESGEEVVVVGYDEEPYLRFAPDGKVYANANSPAAYLNSDRYGRVDVPDDVDPEDPPEWEEVADGGEFVWHDHRSHYMGEGTPLVVEDESVETHVFDYEIPIEVGGRTGSIDGTLDWVGPEDDGAPVVPFVLLAVATLGLVAAVVFVRRRRAGDEDEHDDGDAKAEAW